MATYELEIRTTQQNLDVGSPGAALMANLEVFNGKIGLTIPNDFPAEIPSGVLNVDDTLIIRLINDLPAPIATGIHWHGIELQSNSDGTPVTQNGVPGGDLQVLGGIGGSPVGGTYLYKFKVPRPGIFWFHPHHFHSTNRVFRGTYGMIVVTDPNEAGLIPAFLPVDTMTEQIVLSDITVCGTPGNPLNNPGYDLTLPWAGPGALTNQGGFSPEDICDINAVDETGAGTGAYNAQDVPNIQRSSGKVNEGITVLTNGKNVGARAGSPTAPGAIAAGAILTDVFPGQGLRLQIVNCATTRYFRLLLTTNSGAQIDLVRIGGEGGILDRAIVEGDAIPGGFFKYNEGEILIPPSGRADIVAAIPDDGTTDLTLWTQDFERISGAGGWAKIPTVPVMHLNVTGAAVPVYSINGQPNGVGGTPLRDFTGDPIINLGPETASLLDPAAFSPIKLGMPNEDIQLTNITTAPPPPPALTRPSINGKVGDFSGFMPYSSAAKLHSSRYAKEGDLLHLTVTNTTSAHHPFHLHGFSFQPVSLTPTGAGDTFTWLYQEYRDTLDIPNGYTLEFKVQIETARRFADDNGANIGGSLGRWLFHCHIFFHAHRGMISELIITDSDGTGDEKPNIDVGGSWTYAPTGTAATREGTYFLPDGDTLDTMVSHLADGTPIGDITIVSATKWEWQSHTLPDPALPDQTNYIYTTITGTSGRKDQTVFRLKLGAPDDGSDNGDPHIKTVDGTKYDFQSVGEFKLLGDRDGMVVQSRQTPVPTATPITNSYTGLTSCVSVNTAVAARVGSHFISYQPGQENGTLQFYLDGKPTRLTTKTINLDNNLVRGIEIDGKMTLRVDYEHHAVLIVTPRYWGSNDIHYMNISLSHTHGDEGLMGKIPEGSWLPKLGTGATLGPKPDSINDRYTQLYQTFADSWRVTGKTSMFTYASGTSTATFTDKDWPTIKPPCKLKPGFELPGAIQPAIPEDEAKKICQAVTDGDLFENCVLDVSATGEKSFADGYLIEQRIRQSATSIHLSHFPHEKGGKLKITAIVLPLHKDGAKPTGIVTFYVNGTAVGDPVMVDSKGLAHIIIDSPDKDDKITAEYKDEKYAGLAASSSPNLIFHGLKEDGGDDHDIPDDDGGQNTGRWILWFILLIILLILLGIFFL